jgi:hypothetical protein
LSHFLTSSSSLTSLDTFLSTLIEFLYSIQSGATLTSRQTCHSPAAASYGKASFAVQLRDAINSILLSSFFESVLTKTLIDSGTSLEELASIIPPSIPMTLSSKFSPIHATKRKLGLTLFDEDVIEISSKRQAPNEIIISDDEDETPKEIIHLDDEPPEVISLDHDDKLSPSWNGTGKENDPLVFTERTNGNIIPESDRGKVFEIEEGEDKNDEDEDDGWETTYSPYSIASDKNKLGAVPELTLSQDSITTEHEATPALTSERQDPIQTIDPFESDAVTDNKLHFAQDNNPSMKESPYRPKQKDSTFSNQIDKAQPSITPVSIKTRKRLFYHTYGPRMLPELRKKVDFFLQFVPVKGSENECWLCTDGLPGVTTSNVIQRSFTFHHNGESLHLSVHIGFISMMLGDMLTDEAKEGIIEQRWHASHLCGNWICINPHHIYAEPASINNQRNHCLPHRHLPCRHVPECLKHLKIKGELRNITRESLLAGTGARKHGVGGDVP